MKKIIITTNSPHGDFQKGERGIVDGYCRGGDDVPCAVVIKDDGRFVMVPIYGIIEDKKGDDK